MDICILFTRLYIDGGLKLNIYSTAMYMIMLLHVAFHIVVYRLTIHFIVCFFGKDYNTVTVEPMSSCDFKFRLCCQPEMTDYEICMW